MQITAFTETFNLKHNTIVLGISSYYPQKYMSGTPLKCQKRWGFRGLRPLTPTKGLCPLDPRRGHRPRNPPQIKMKWRPWSCPWVDGKTSQISLFLAIFINLISSFSTPVASSLYAVSVTSSTIARCMLCPLSLPIQSIAWPSRVFCVCLYVFYDTPI